MDKKNLPVQIDEYKIAKFVDVEDLASFINSIPIVPGTNTVAGIMLAWNYKRQEQFLIDVIEDRLKISQSEVDKTSFLKRFYLTSQVVAKAQTQEKYNRFKKLLLNSTLFEVADDDYELYNNLIDELTDKEFVFLSHISKLKQQGIPQENANEYKDCCDKLGNKDEKNLLQARLAGKGLILQAAAFGGLSFKEVLPIAHALINFIDKGDVIDA